MSEMVERIARAIVKTCGGSDPEVPEWAKACARAAIEVMREPTDAMASVYSDPGDWDAVMPEDVWKAMLSEAAE